MKGILLDLSMPILTPRLVLKKPEIGDGAMVNEAVIETFDQLHGLMPWANTKPTIADSEEYVRQAAANWILKKDEEPYLPVFIFDRNNNTFIGGTGFHHINWSVPCLEIGYWIRTKFSGKGLMTEAVNALTRYALDALGTTRIEIRCDKDNLKSKKIPERLGYHLESTLKANRRNIMNGEISDTLVYVKHDSQGLPNLSVSWEKK